jgi:tetratricopeptide (TPR) repeat protein
MENTENFKQCADAYLNGKKAALYALLDQLHDSDDHEGIIRVVESIPKELRDVEIIGKYGRALNNADRMEEALTVLLSVKEACATDAIWNFRVAYAYFYLDREREAALYFQKAIELGDTNPDAQYLLEECRRITELKRKANRKLKGMFH